MQNATTTQVTQEQLDRCTRIEDLNNRTVFYRVLSERDDFTEYTVRFIKGKGFTCTCPSGLEGFRSCSHGTCKHCRWASAHAEEYRKERREQGQIEAYVRQGVSRDTATAVVYAQGPSYTEAQIKQAQARNQRQAFSLLK